MMSTVVISSAAIPILWGWWVHRRTTLAHSFFWIAMAWFAWWVSSRSEGPSWRYLAVCLTCCAGVAVLGARRPGVTAWHAVVAGLTAVLLLPLAEGFFSGRDLSPSDNLRWLFLAVATAFGLLNYVPTRLGIAASLMLLAVAGELYLLRWAGSETWHQWAVILAGAAPWVGWMTMSLRRTSADQATQRWLDFRNRFGVVWAWRLREQFNNSSLHRQLGLELTWGGVRRSDGGELSEADREGANETLAALMLRFGMVEPPGIETESGR
ncbi:MAG: hypothetical protein N2039_08045 [Gemmataceae bacterium]|nr:hypothetical protein [Gemmataceae bacterium]